MSWVLLLLFFLAKGVRSKHVVQTQEFSVNEVSALSAWRGSNRSDSQVLFGNYSGTAIPQLKFADKIRVNEVSIPSGSPSRQPSSQPTYQPTSQPSRQPSSQPTNQPTRQPSRQPSSQPTNHPTRQPSCQPSSHPTMQPTSRPSTQPTGQPTNRPTTQPQSLPSSMPSAQPFSLPTSQPTRKPSSQPTKQPSGQPSESPTEQPSAHPTMQPTSSPTQLPSSQPSSSPTSQPTYQPIGHPTGCPTAQPSAYPSSQPVSFPTSTPSAQPSSKPTVQPSTQPSMFPSSQPSAAPTSLPTVQPSSSPSSQPSSIPSLAPSSQPSSRPTLQPSVQPTGVPSAQPFGAPTSEPSSQPSSKPTKQPTSQPSGEPTSQPILLPTSIPSSQPTSQPSTPTSQPSSKPTAVPTFQPTSRPSGQPTVQPSMQPSLQPIAFPTSSPSSIPTSAPSCGLGHEGTHGSCIPCEPGYYLSDREWEYCRKCEMDYIQPHSAQSDCTKCEYPLATMQTGSTKCDAWGLMLNVPGLWFVYTVVLSYCIFQFGLLFYTHLDWHVGVFCLLSFGQLCNTLGDVFFFITQRMFVSIFALIVGVVFVKIIFFLWIVQTKIEHPNVFAANHLQKLLTGDGVIFWLRFVNGSVVDVRRKAQPLHILSSGDDAATPERFMMYLADQLLFLALQLFMILGFVMWMVSTSFLWFPVLFAGFCLMEMKVLCFWSIFRYWNFFWTWKADQVFKDERLNAWDTAMHQHVSVLMWKYSIISDGLLQSLPMFALKLTHLLYFPTLSILQRSLLTISIALSGLYCIYGAVIYFAMEQHRRSRRGVDILQEQAPTIINLVRNQEQPNLSELHYRVDELRLRIQNQKANTAEQQLFVALQCHTQESVDIMLRVASLGTTSPDKLRYGSAASISEVISHVKHHPLPGDPPPLKDEEGRDKDPHEPLRKTLRSIANCITIQKSFLYRTMRFYNKRFAQAVNDVRRHYRVENMSISEKLMWYSGVSVLVMFVKIFLLYVTFLIDRFNSTLLMMARHSRWLRYLFNFCRTNCWCGGETSPTEMSPNPVVQQTSSATPDVPHDDTDNGIEMLPPENSNASPTDADATVVAATTDLIERDGSDPVGIL